MSSTQTIGWAWSKIPWKQWKDSHWLQKGPVWIAKWNVTGNGIHLSLFPLWNWVPPFLHKPANLPMHPPFFFLISSLPGLKKDWYHLIIFQCCTLVMTATCSHKANQRVLPLPETSMTARKWEGVATKLHGEEGVLLELHPHHSASSNSIEIAHLLQGWRAALLLGWGLTCPPASVQTLGYFDFAWKSGFLFRFLTMLCIWGLQNHTSGHFTQCYFLNERKNSRPLTLQLNFFPSPEPKWLRTWQIQGWP